jgi:hypothetical protein
MAVLKVCSGGQWRVLFGSASVAVKSAAPAIVGITPGNAQATVSWTPPLNNGGSPILDYTVTLSTGQTATVSAGTFTALVNGLTNGVPVTATVAARNAIGTTTSTSSAAATPSASASATKLTASLVGITGAGLTTADLSVWDVAIQGRDIPAGTYDKVWFKNITTAGLRLVANGITFTRCRFDGPAAWSNPAVGSRYLFLFNTNTQAGRIGHQFTDCEIRGGGSQASTAYPSSYTGIPKPFPASGSACQNPFQPGMAFNLLRCHVRQFEHLLQPSDNPAGSSILIDTCLFNEPILVQYASDVTHMDGMQTAGSGVHDLELRFCTFDLYQPGNIPGGQIANTGSGGIFGGFPASPIVPKGSAGNAVAQLVNVDIHHNYFDGGQYAWHFQKAAYAPNLSTWLGSAQNFKVRDNRYGVHHNAIRDTVGTALDGTQLQWTNNVWDETGTTLLGVPVLAGQLIP